MRKKTFTWDTAGNRLIPKHPAVIPEPDREAFICKTNQASKVIPLFRQKSFVHKSVRARAMEKILTNAFEAFDNQRYGDALRLLREALDKPLSVDERVNAYNHIAYIYEMGLETQPSHVEAIKWYEEAAKLEDVSAQFELGQLFRNNLKDNQRAMFWYEKAGARRYSPALYQLGIAYDVGDIVERDKAKGELYLQQAAASGHFLARAVIARKSLRGQYGLVGVFRGLLGVVTIPVSASLAKKANPLDDRLR
ncbi:MAG: sel1 repeat family protein [Thiogranum sp.]|nr:sel1 repeat family protein [Thiogranum sp.]